MRPRSEERRRFEDAARRLAQGPQRGGTYLDLAREAGLTEQRAKNFVKNLAHERRLVSVGERLLPHARRPLAVYAPAELAAARQLPMTGPHLLQQVLRGWSGPALMLPRFITPSTR